MDGITKDELKVMLEVQSKSVEQLTVIARNLQDLVIEQRKITEGSFTVLPIRVAEKVSACCVTASDKFALIKQTIEQSEKHIEKIKEDTFWLKIILGAVTLIAVLSQVVLRAMEHKL
jgi:hypothetical protein